MSKFSMSGLQGRHLARVPIDPELIHLLCKQGNEMYVKCITGLPPGAKWISEYFDYAEFRLYFIFEHESFDVVYPGGTLPALFMEYEMRLIPSTESVSESQK